jgi:CBS domain-containing protein
VGGSEADGDRHVPPRRVCLAVEATEIGRRDSQAAAPGRGFGGTISSAGGRPMNVDGILRAKGATVYTIRPDNTVGDLVLTLRENRIGAMVVSEDGRSVLGMISERDVVRGLAELGPRVLETAVAELMTRLVVSCTPQDSVKHVMTEMTKRRIRHLPVLADGALCGIVSIGDIVKNRLEEMETETNVLREAYLGAR